MSLKRLIATFSIVMLAACSDSNVGPGDGQADDAADTITDTATTPLISPSISDAPAQIYTLSSEIEPLIFAFTPGDYSISGCTGSLPAGLGVAVSSDGTSCEISGTPTAEQTATTHTITAIYSEGSDTANVDITVRGKVSLKLSYVPTKVFRLTWNAISGVDHYNLLENPDGVSGFELLGRMAAGTEAYDHTVPLYARVNARYALEACFSSDDTDCQVSAIENVAGTLAQSIGYLKSSNSGSDDYFGAAIALSADGSTLAVGAYEEDSATTDINSIPDNLAADSGAVYLFRNVSGQWTQQAYIKASNAEADDHFGVSVALSADGNILAIGAHREDSFSSGASSMQNNLTVDSGAVYMYRYIAGNWYQSAFIKASNPGFTDVFGFSLALSADGNTLAVGAYQEASSTSGVNTVPDDLAGASGAVYVFRSVDRLWSQQAYIKASNSGPGDNFGIAIDLSADGNTLAVGALREDSATTGINSEPDDLANNSGAAYLFRYADDHWAQQAYIKADNAESMDYFGVSVALSADGNTLAVGAHRESSSTTGVNSTPDNLANARGAVYVYRDVNGGWIQQAYVKPSNTAGGINFGYSVALSADGQTLAVGAIYESSSSSGINSTPDILAHASGAAYLYRNDNETWLQQAYIKASNTEKGDLFGHTVRLSADGNTLAVGATSEDSATTGINSVPDNAAIDSGAVYLY